MLKEFKNWKNQKMKMVSLPAALHLLQVEDTTKIFDIIQEKVLHGMTAGGIFPTKKRRVATFTQQ